MNIQRPAKIKNHVERGIVTPRLQSPQIGDGDIGPKRDLFLGQVAAGAQASQRRSEMLLSVHIEI